jgi:hypothetical protein
MNMHGRIMNLPGAGGLSEIGTTHGEQLAYKRGHRDARHAAAEIAVKGDALVEELVAALAAMCKSMPTDGEMRDGLGWEPLEVDAACNAYDAASAALAKARE